MAEQNDRTTLGTAEWGRGFVEELARETLKEKRAKRRWRIFLWLVFFALVGFSVQRCTQVGAGQQGGEDVMPANFVASISIEGVLASGTGNEEAVSAEHVNRALRRCHGLTLPQPAIEVSSLYYDWKFQQLPPYQQHENADIDLRFATILQALDLPVRDAHDALNDAVMAALAFIRLRELRGEAMS